MNDNVINELASKHLGKKSAPVKEYDPSLLVKIPRSINREQYNIQNNNLPFLGCDVWQAYEFSSMTENNLPFSSLLKLKYDCNSDFLVESKSLKLYLNSFNMSSFGSNIEESKKICKEKIEFDLSELLETKVEANFLDEEIKTTKIFENFKNILDFVNEKTLKITEFKENPNLIQFEEKEIQKYYLKFNSLRSNCRVTHQPDFGDVFIYYKSQKHIKEETLVQYLCSFRQEYHFHEECCEMIFKRLYDILNSQDELFVACLYTRRGGIDINPIRYTPNCEYKDFEYLKNIKTYARCGVKQ